MDSWSRARICGDGCPEARGGEALKQDAGGGAPVRSWAVQVPSPPGETERESFGFEPEDYQTTFREARLGSHAPVNNQASIGVPGAVPLSFSYVMRSRCSEFDIALSVETDDEERRPFVLEGFRQESPEGWLPGCVSQWDEGGVHYQVNVITVPNDPRPIDLYEIRLRSSVDQAARGHLIVTLNGAPTRTACADLISDRGKPLMVMDPPVEVERISSSSGCVDPPARPRRPLGVWGTGNRPLDTAPVWLLRDADRGQAEGGPGWDPSGSIADRGMAMWATRSSCPIPRKGWRSRRTM